MNEVKANQYLDQALELLKQGHADQAEVLLKKIDSAIPSHPRIVYFLGVCASMQGNKAKAIAFYDRVIRIYPQFVEAYNNRGLDLLALGRYRDALRSFYEAIGMRPDFVEAYLNLGVVLVRLGQYDEAMTAYRHSLELRANNPNAFSNLGDLYLLRDQSAEALQSYVNAFALDPDTKWLGGSIILTRMKLGNWPGLNEVIKTTLERVQAGERASQPFPMLSFSPSLMLQKKCAEVYSQSEYSMSTRHHMQLARHMRIRLGYLSCDFKEHPVSYLMAGVLATHNRDRFEVIGFDIGEPVDSSTRQRVVATFDDFERVGDRSDDEIAELIHHHEIDILIDLVGHTKGARTGILARKPAPIQVNYLGFPGTMGANFIDYVIGDPLLIPQEFQSGYSEKVVYLPECFQANDNKRLIAPVKDRSYYGLSDSVFVFGAFTQGIKLTADVFTIWLSILKQVPDSVLWLVKENDDQVNNLRAFANRQNVSTDRLIFAGKLPYAEHLARYALVELALDTVPFNGGATTSDALWGGAPVLTCVGEAFAGRMSASLLNTVGLPELITTSLTEYEAMAVDLATNPAKLNAIRQKLKDNRLTSSLFDTPRFTRHLENAYEQMLERHLKRLAPDHIYVPSIE